MTHTNWRENKPEKQGKGWGERFDKKYPDGLMKEYDRKTDTWEIDVTDEIKTFITSELSKAKSETIHSVLALVDEKIKENYTIFGLREHLAEAIKKLEEK